MHTLPNLFLITNHELYKLYNKPDIMKVITVGQNPMESNHKRRQVSSWTVVSVQQEQ
jgi:hypothetical protein